jgi:hypothetical protein
MMAGYFEQAEERLWSLLEQTTRRKGAKGLRSRRGSAAFECQAESNGRQQVKPLPLSVGVVIII